MHRFEAWSAALWSLSTRPLGDDSFGSTNDLHTLEYVARISREQPQRSNDAEISVVTADGRGFQNAPCALATTRRAMTQKICGGKMVCITVQRAVNIRQRKMRARRRAAASE